MISDDELLLYYYRDGLDAADRARIGAALSEQPELARRMQALVARLDAAAASPEVPVPAEVQRALASRAGARGSLPMKSVNIARHAGSSIFDGRLPRRRCWQFSRSI